MLSITKTFPLAVAVAALSAGLLSHQAVAAENASAALAVLESQGYVAVHDLELRHGHWSAEATTQNGTRVQLLLDGADQLVEVGNPASSAQIATAQQVVERLQGQGYQQVHDVELDDGFWQAEARTPAGVEVDLVLHPVTLELLSERVDGQDYAPASNGDVQLSAAQVHATLTQAGYSRVQELDYDDGYWEADAVNPAGQWVELTIDPYSGAVVREQLDD